MPDFDLLTAWLLTSYGRIHGHDRDAAGESDRGDVPGWVMVTIMTAGLVIIVFAAFKGAISGAIDHAIKNVTGSTN